MKFTNENNGFGLVLRCPVCDSEYTLLSNTESYKNNDDRLAVFLTFNCEEGHSFAFNLQNDKGYTVCKTEIQSNT